MKIMTEFKDDSYYESLDKRTKEYKEWKKHVAQIQEQETSGVGDVVAKITQVTGIAKAVKTFFGEDCGCDDRQKWLNMKLPFARGVINEVGEDDYYFLKDIFSRKTRGKYTVEEMKDIVRIYNYVYEKREVPSDCTSCRNTNIIKAIHKLERYFESTTEFIEDVYLED